MASSSLTPADVYVLMLWAVAFFFIFILPLLPQLAADREGASSGTTAGGPATAARRLRRRAALIKTAAFTPATYLTLSITLDLLALCLNTKAGGDGGEVSVCSALTPTALRADRSTAALISAFTLPLIAHSARLLYGSDELAGLVLLKNAFGDKLHFLPVGLLGWFCRFMTLTHAGLRRFCTKVLKIARVSPQKQRYAVGLPARLTPDGLVAEKVCGGVGELFPGVVPGSDPVNLEFARGTDRRLRGGAVTGRGELKLPVREAAKACSVGRGLIIETPPKRPNTNQIQPCTNHIPQYMAYPLVGRGVEFSSVLFGFCRAI